MSTDLKQIKLTEDILKKANPLMISAVNGINRTFGLVDKMRKGLKASGTKTIVLIFDENSESNDLTQPPFTIYASSDDVVLRIKQLEHLTRHK